MYSENILSETEDKKHKNHQGMMVTNIISRENVFPHPSVLGIPYILQAAAFTQYDNVKNFLLIIASKTAITKRHIYF